MTTRKRVSRVLGTLCVLAVAALGVQVAFAHCDSLGSPVVKAAKNALQAGNVNLVLIWVQQGRTGDPGSVSANLAGAQAKPWKRRRWSTIPSLGPWCGFIGPERVPPTLASSQRGRGSRPCHFRRGQALGGGNRGTASGPPGRRRSPGPRGHVGDAHCFEDMAPTTWRRGRRYIRAHVEYIPYVRRVAAATTSATGLTTTPQVDEPGASARKPVKRRLSGRCDPGIVVCNREPGGTPCER